MKTSGLSMQDRREFGLSLCVLLTACAQRPDIGAHAGDAAPPAAGSAETPAASSRRAPGENPFGLPAVSTTGRAGDFALVPSRSSLSQAFEQAPGSQSLLYSGAYIDRPGALESTVAWLTQQRASIPNSLLIVVPRSERAARGDIVLTTSVSGSGLERAIVVSEGESESPRVRSLDLPFDRGSAGSAEREVTLPESTFRILRVAGELGTTHICRRGERNEHFVLIAITGERRLGLGFAGRTLLFPPGACRALPLVPPVQAGARAFVPVAGVFVPAKVSGVDARSGRVSVEYEFAGEPKEMAVGYTNVATELP